MAGVIGGVVGAVLAAVGVPLLQGPPPLAPAAEQRLASVESAAAGVDRRLTEVAGTLDGAVERLTAVGDEVGALGALAGRLDATVEAAVTAAVAAIPSRDGAALAALGERLDGVADTVASLEAAAAAAVDPAPLLAAQAQRLETLQAALGSLDNRLAAETQRLTAERAEALNAVRATLGDETGRLAAAIAATEAAVDRAREAAQSELAGVRTELAGAIAGVDAELATTREALGALEASVANLQLVRHRAAAAALLVRDIDRSITVGEPFADPLARLVAMSAGDSGLAATLAALEPVAAGVPTIEALRQGLVALDARQGAAPIAGSDWLGRTVGNITGLVEVRERDAEGEAVTGLLGEADAALRRDDLVTAIARVEAAAALPDRVDPAAAAAWLGQARARLTAVTAQTALDAQIRELLTATVN